MEQMSTRIGDTTATLCKQQLQGGHENVTQLLIGYGADVNAKGGNYGNALQAAANMDHERAVLLLIELGADINVEGGSYGTALQAAACTSLKITQLLIEHGADVNVVGRHYGNALQAAAGRGNIERLLIEHGAI